MVVLADIGYAGYCPPRSLGSRESLSYAHRLIYGCRYTARRLCSRIRVLFLVVFRGGGWLCHSALALLPKGPARVRGEPRISSCRMSEHVAWQHGTHRDLLRL